MTKLNPNPPSDVPDAPGKRQARPSLLEKYPHSERFRLKNNEKVFLPVHQSDFNFIVLQGAAKLTELNKILRDEDLEAFEDSPGFGMVQLYCIDYRSGDVGSYKETFEVFRILQKHIGGKPAPSSSDNQYFVRRVGVTTEKPVRFGIEVWGYPKKLGVTHYSEDSGDVTFSFSDTADRTAFHGSCKNALSLQTTYVPENRFAFVTPYEFRRSHASVINAGDFSRREYKVGLDTFEVDVTTPLGAELRSIGFEPKLWWFCRNMQAVGFVADVPAPASRPVRQSEKQAVLQPEIGATGGQA